MCNRDMCARFLLYFYVLGLWCLSPFVYIFCNHLLELDTCMAKQNNLPCKECFTQYSWDHVAGVIGCLYSVNAFSFTIMCFYIVYRRYQIWRNETKARQMYNHMVR